MTNSKAIIDAVVESGKESTCFVCDTYTEWRNARGNLHREDGPAIKYNMGIDLWYKNGLRHRLGGPAIECVDGENHFYVNGRHFTEDEFYKYVDQETGEVFIPPGKKLEHD